MSKEAPLDKQDKAEINNYTRTPNMLIFGYHDTLSPQEKWLYVCLKHLCGKRGTRHLSLRYISEQTGISTGALSKSKHSEGMIRHLHDAGLIHAEIKKPGKGNPQYHITITDVWGLNQSFFSKRSEFGQEEEENSEPVRISDEPVQNSDRSVHVSDEPVRNSANTNIRDKTTYKITEQEESARAPAHFSEQEQTTLLKLGIQIAAERVDEAIEDVEALQAEQLSGSHPAYTKEQTPPRLVPPNDAGGNRVKGPDRPRASGRRGKAQQDVTQALSLQGAQVKEWMETLKGRKLRMTPKNVEAWNSLGDEDEMSQENLRDVIETWEGLKWVQEHDYAIDAQVLAQDDGKFTFSKGMEIVRRKRKKQTSTDTKPKDEPELTAEQKAKLEEMRAKHAAKKVGV